MPSNTAAWLTAAKANPLEVKSAPYTSPHENEIVIKNGAVAVNPVDWALQAMGEALFPWIVYPCILGEDVAGEVVEVGSAVSRFKPGDRVLGHGVGSTSGVSASGSTFQAYTVLLAHMASPIPSTLSYESAAVLPLCLSTAACGLFQEDYLALQHPSVPPKLTGKALLVWGGGTSVGSNGIQLATAAGYEVITTCSPKNFDYVKRLGASQAFDYSSKTIVDELSHAFKGKTVAGVLCCVGGIPGVFEACADTLLNTTGDKFIATCRLPPEKIPDGISAKFILGGDLKDNEVSKTIYVDFLPEALAEGKYIAAPDPVVVGKGLEFIQAGLDHQKKGMSAEKVVVSL